VGQDIVESSDFFSRFRKNKNSLTKRITTNPSRETTLTMESVSYSVKFMLIYNCALFHKQTILTILIVWNFNAYTFRISLLSDVLWQSATESGLYY
jgi:hypothetical protein